jgi:ribonuclease J
MGLPDKTRKGASVVDLVADTVSETVDGLSRQKRRDTQLVENAVDRAVRSAVNQVWGKKPACHVMVVEV